MRRRRLTAATTIHRRATVRRRHTIPPIAAIIRIIRTIARATRVTPAAQATEDAIADFELSGTERRLARVRLVRRGFSLRGSIPRTLSASRDRDASRALDPDDPMARPEPCLAPLSLAVFSDLASASPVRFGKQCAPASIVATGDVTGSRQPLCRDGEPIRAPRIVIP